MYLPYISQYFLCKYTVSTLSVLYCKRKCHHLLTAKYPDTFRQASKLWWLKYKPHIGINCLTCHRRRSLHSGIVSSRWVACGFFWHGGCMDGCLFPAKHGAAIGSMSPLSRMFSVTLLPNERVN